MVLTDESARYIAIIEHKYKELLLENLRFRTLMEVLTDEQWDEYPFSAEDREIKKLAVDALKRRVGLSDEDARKLVDERWERYNPPEPTEAALATVKKYAVGTGPTPWTITTARPIGDSGPSFDVDKHLQGRGRVLERRRQKAIDEDRHR
jgi:hypothetical protein